MNSSSLRDTRFKCEELAEKYPNAKIYWAYIVSQNYESFDKTWVYRDNKENVVHEINDNIRNIAGKDVYTLVTGDETAFEQSIPNLFIFRSYSSFKFPFIRK